MMKNGKKARAFLEQTRESGRSNGHNNDENIHCKVTSIDEKVKMFKKKNEHQNDVN